MITSETPRSLEAARPNEKDADWSETPVSDRPVAYLVYVVGLAIAGMLAIFVANRVFAPEMYLPQVEQTIGKTLANGKNYAVFDLNVNIREIRDAQVANLRARPDTVILGASHWQEAHSDLLPDNKLLNVHVHRDYYEDLLAMTEILVRHDKLPRRMIIAIRDNIFTPVDQRRDHLWLPGIPYYRAMAKRLGIETHSYWSTWPTERLRELVSLQMLFNNVTRWHNADEHPQPTNERYFKTLDTLLSGGSIVWSREHRAVFTSERATRLALAAAEAGQRHPPVIDPAGIEAVDALIEFLSSAGVEVVLAHPPFNPVFFNKVKAHNDDPYMHGLRRVEAVTRRFAQKFSLRTIGSFNPEDLGCTDSMFIDSEHANPLCLSRIFDQLDPGTSGPHSWTVSEAASKVDEPQPTDDLARQQLLILQNSRTHVALGGLPVSMQSLEVVVAAASVPADMTPSAPSGTLSKPRRTPVSPTRTAATQVSKAAATQRPTRRVIAAATEDRHEPRVRQADRAAHRHRELVWPGDVTPDRGSRRLSRLQRVSSVDR